MKFELLIIACTAFLAFNTYYDGYYLRLVQSWKKYYLIGGYIFAGLCAYLFIKRNPSDSRTMMAHANNLIKYMPIDKEAMDILTPVLDFTSASGGQQSASSLLSSSHNGYQQTPQFKRMMNSGTTESATESRATKRSVSETKKKFVASQQQWKCGSCHIQLPAWFEVDHKIKLEHGGSNHISNLVALCRDCHGKKTTMENL